MAARAFALSPPSSALPPKGNTRGYTKIYFGENQLLPSSISFSLLTPTHPKVLNNLPVRTSSRPSSTFILVRASSLGFGSYTYRYVHCWTRPFQTSFRCASPSPFGAISQHYISLAFSDAQLRYRDALSSFHDFSHPAHRDMLRNRST